MWANSTARCILQSFSVTHAPAGIKGHHLLRASLDLQLAKQKVCSFKKLQQTDVEYASQLEAPLALTFIEMESAIQRHDLAAAVRAWSQQAECVLDALLPPDASHGYGRGRVKTVSRTVTPTVHCGHASTLRDRALVRALNRLKEVRVAAPGVRREYTWNNLLKVLPYLSDSAAPKFRSLWSQGWSLANVDNLLGMINYALTQCGGTG